VVGLLSVADCVTPEGCSSPWVRRNRLVKETDRSWEQGEDPSILDFKIKEFGNESKLAIADTAERKQWRELGVRHLMRKSGLSQKTVYAILGGEPVRRRTLLNFMRVVDSQLAALARPERSGLIRFVEPYVEETGSCLELSWSCGVSRDTIPESGDVGLQASNFDASLTRILCAA